MNAATPLHATPDAQFFMDADVWGDRTAASKNFANPSSAMALPASPSGPADPQLRTRLRD